MRKLCFIILFACILTSCQNKENTQVITEENIKNNLPERYSWYYQDSIKRPYQGFIVKGDSIKLDFNFHSNIVTDIFGILDDYKEKTISLSNNFIYKTYSKQTDEGISFYGILRRRGQEDFKRKNCLLFIKTPKNVFLNDVDHKTFDNLFNNFKP